MRLGVFGGTFDPVHHGHLIVAAEACRALSLDRLLFIPAAEPPHKGGAVIASSSQRLRMLEQATRNDPRFVVEDIELQRAGPSFTVDTLRALRSREPDAELFFLLGVDQFRQLDRWRRPAEVAKLAKLAVLARGGETPELRGPYEAIPVPVSRIDVASTEIRRLAAAGESIRYYVPEAVWAIIEGEGIYKF